MPCCSREQRRMLLIDGRHFVLCVECGAARFTTTPQDAPSADALEAYLLDEYRDAKKTDRNQRPFKARVLSYQAQSPLKAEVRLEVKPDQWFDLDVGDDALLKFGNENRAAWVQDIVETTLAAYVEPLQEPLEPNAEVELRRTPAARLAENQLEFFRIARTTAHLLDPLLDPNALPKQDETEPPDPPPDSLNAEQAAAFRRALATPRGGATLILGPPGTGKTIVVAQLVSTLVRRGHSVLVTAHTHVAIDNALMMALRLDPSLRTKIARLGPSIKVAPALESYYYKPHEFEMGEETEKDERRRKTLSAIFERCPLVGLTLDNLIGRLRRSQGGSIDRFDYAIVDEASMNLLPKTAAAAAAAERLILVGDHFQLPPIVTLPYYAAKPPFTRSLFEHIATTRSDLVSLLNRQYRSVPGIMAWSNETFYDGSLKDVRRDRGSRVRIAGRAVGTPIIWIDTSKLSNDEHLARRPQSGGTPSFGNPLHVAIALSVIADLVASGIQAGDIGYISPYRLQTSVFRKLASRHIPRGQGFLVTASTVDAFQGSERRVILYDFTTTTPQKSHASPNRLNVSLTRAQDLLIIIGHREFAAAPEEQAVHWSLERRLAAFAISAATIRVPAAWLRDAEHATRYGEVAPISRISSLEDFIDRPEFTPDHYAMLQEAFEKRRDETLCAPKLLQIVQQVAPKTNVKALYTELSRLSALPADRNRDLKSALRAAQSILLKPNPGIPLPLQLRPVKSRIESALAKNTPMSEYLQAQVERVVKGVREAGG